ncbi:riboflavin kinase [Salimicrobium halophilum]|uniref:Riboflavin biosynthesis protein n=1 Tax=Salimicrobium halophilum TaxID=86666 RepID=A0A1G8WQ71_9BACI|nr:riboflavin kinase [Salimicrobium halophilum]SDJ80444.1 FMN adenylyltransferase /riboflavin kinase [Salimicrobium halophilum]
METKDWSQVQQTEEPLTLVIADFDGMHLGHHNLLAQAQRRGDRIAVLDTSLEEQRLLTPLHHKKELLTHYGVAAYYHCADKEAIRRGVQTLQPAHVIMEDESLELTGAEIFPSSSASSEEIRSMVENGRVEAALAHLGRPYAIKAEVTKGQALGRELGFPTINLGGSESYVDPAPGVYIGSVVIHEEVPRQYYTLISAGYRPTVNGTSYKVEAYILDFNEDIYGKDVTLTFLRHMRGEVNFDGLDALVDQMKQDEVDAREILGLQQGKGD